MEILVFSFIMALGCFFIGGYLGVLVCKFIGVLISPFWKDDYNG